MIRRIGKAIGNTVVERVGRVASRVHERHEVPVDVLEGDAEYVLVFDAPGVQQSDVQVRYVDNSVLVRIDRFREYYEGYEMRYPGRGLSLDGSVSLPADADVDPDAATAILKQSGTLEIRLPKAD